MKLISVHPLLLVASSVLGACTAVAALLLMGMHTQSESPAQVRARELVLLDSSGKVSARMGMGKEGGACLELIPGKDDRPRVRIAVGAFGLARRSVECSRHRFQRHLVTVIATLGENGSPRRPVQVPGFTTRPINSRVPVVASRIRNRNG